jgi:hypothetical protein
MNTNTGHSILNINCLFIPHTSESSHTWISTGNEYLHTNLTVIMRETVHCTLQYASVGALWKRLEFKGLPPPPPGHIIAQPLQQSSVFLSIWRRNNWSSFSAKGFFSYWESSSTFGLKRNWQYQFRIVENCSFKPDAWNSAQIQIKSIPKSTISNVGMP